MSESQHYFEIIKNKKLHHNHESFKKYLKTLYRNIDFEGKKVLDIGAGNGFHSFYAASCGAEKVVAIEPESLGAQEGFLSDFKKNSDLFKFENVSLFSDTLQNFNQIEEKFDIIISHYSVNHLNEDACERLRKDENARKVYSEIFSKISSFLKNDGMFILVDCSDSNIFSALKLKNPFAPSIEWEKHQNPNIWANLAEKSGFKKKDLVWLPPYQLQDIGYFLLSHKLGGFLTHGHFALFFSKPADLPISSK